MLSEAASLRHVSSLYPFTQHPEHQPAIVIVTVDVKDLLALDTEDTREVLASIFQSWRTRVTLKARIQ
jgi:exonuclease I